MRRTPLTLAASASLVLVATSFMTPTQAAAPARTAGNVLANNLVGPLSVAVAGNGNAFVAESFSGELTRIKPSGKQRTLWSSKKNEVAGVSVASGVVTFTTTNYGTGRALVRQFEGGEVTTLADSGAFEADANPDGEQMYGFLDLDAECEAQFPDDNPPNYAGIVESHPYGTASAGGTTYLADAAGNSVVAIDPSGVMSTVAVLPTVPLTVPPGMAEQFGFPSCVEGHDYHLEPVPTDVEVAPDGDLFVTSLPGGPEGLLPNGSVFEIDLPSGQVDQVATGFTSATGVALAGNGDLYVAELAGGKISRVPAGSSTPELFHKAAMPAAVEIRGEMLYATTRVLSEEKPGKLVAYALH